MISHKRLSKLKILRVNKCLDIISNVTEGKLMASFVLLLKDYEDDEKVIYRFGPNEHHG